MSIAFVYVFVFFSFFRKRSPRGDHGLKTCLLALISNISTTTHLCFLFVVCPFRGSQSKLALKFVRKRPSPLPSWISVVFAGTFFRVNSRSSLDFLVGVV